MRLVELALDLGHLHGAVPVADAADVGIDEVRVAAAVAASVMSDARRPSYSSRRLSWNAHATIWPSIGRCARAADRCS